MGQSAVLTAPAWCKAIPPVGVCTELLTTSCNKRLLYEHTELAGFPGSCRVIPIHSESQGHTLSMT